MPDMSSHKYRIALLATLAILLVPASASALTISKAELKGGQLRLEGTSAAPGILVLANSQTSSASSRSDQTGAFKIQASGFTSPDCKVLVSDGRTPIAQPTLAGCTPTAPTPPGRDPAPSGTCVVDSKAPATFHVGDLSTYFFTTTGCDTSAGAVQWTLVAGAIPPGMTGPFFQGQTAGAISGRPTTEGTYTFTVKVTDSAGQTDEQTFTNTIVAPRPLTVTNTAGALPAASVGQGYSVVLNADGGLPGYAWSIAAGKLPPGIGLFGSTIGGIPTTPGTFAFTVRVADSRGTTADRNFTITVS
jgi:Putative Ig domain